MEKKEKNKKIDKINYKNLNKTINITNHILKLTYVVLIIVFLILLSTLFKRYHIFSFIGEVISVISPLFIGFLIAWLVDPLITKLSSCKLNRIVSSIIVYVLIIAIIITIMVLTFPALGSQIKDLINQLPTTLLSLKESFDKLIASFGGNGVDITKFNEEIYSKITAFVSSFSASFANIVISFGKGLVNVISKLLLSIMIAFYLSLTFNKFNSSVKEKISKKWLPYYEELLDKLNTTLRSYVGGVLLIMILVFITQAIGFSLAGLKAPLVFALFCALTDIIPYFGPWIGGIPAVIVGFTISPLTGILTLVAIFVVQILENNIYQPIIMGHTMSLHPIVIMLGLLLFGHFFGIIGMIIATPVIACFKVIIDYIKEVLKTNKKMREQAQNTIEKITNIEESN